MKERTIELGTYGELVDFEERLDRPSFFHENVSGNVT